MNRRDKARARVNGQLTMNNEPNHTLELHPVEVPQSRDLKPVKTISNIDDVNKVITQTELQKSLVSIDRFIERSYLASIDKSSIIPLMKTKDIDGKSVEVFNMPGEPTNLPSYRWYRIDKIVYEKNVFFTDKFSMLFSALHAEAAQVALVIEKKNGNTKLYLGARDKKDNVFNISGDTLEAAINGFLTGVHATVTDNNDLKDLTNQYFTPAVACVSGVASLRDNKKEDFVQGLERLINSTSEIPSFTAFFIADSITEVERQDIVSAFETIYRSLSPMKEFHASVSKGESKSLTDSVSDSVTNTVGKTIGRTIANGSNFTTNESKSYGSSTTKGTYSGWNESKTIGITEGFSFGGSVTPFGIGYNAGYNSSVSESTTIGHSHGSQKSETKSKQNTIGSSKGTTHSTSDSTQQTTQDARSKQTSSSKMIGSEESYSLQITTQDLHVKDLMETIETQIKRLRNAAPFGLWNCATYFVSNTETTSRKIANIYKGTIIGEDSGIELAVLNSWDESSPVNQEIVKYLGYGINPRFIVDGQNVSAGTTVSSKELAIHMALPQSSVPGISVQKRASFGRNVTRYSSLQSETEDNLLESEQLGTNNLTIKLGSVIHLGKTDEKNSVCININDLSRHTFVTGTTGSGKSNTMFLILDSLYQAGKKFLVIEPKKGEYKKVLGGLDNVQVYSANPFESKLLTINPFSFDYEKGIMVYEHVGRLVEIFNACWPMYAAMPEVLKKSILDAYKNSGWNIKRSEPIDKNNVLFPTVEDVIIALQKYINSSEFSADSKSDYKGAIETRLMGLMEGSTGLMLNSRHEIANKELFNKNVIIDLSRVGNSETVSLIMGIIILKLNEYRTFCCDLDEELSHVTVIEEAHNILKRTSTVQNQESSNLIGKSVEMISDCMAEMRAFGEGFIIVDQSPAQVDLSTIRNTNTKIIMALPDEDDCRTVGKSICLTDEQIAEISKQKVGHAIVYQNDWEEPVQCIVDKYEKKSSYEKKVDNCILDEADDSLIHLDIIKFLVAGRLDYGPRFNIESVMRELPNCILPSTFKFALLNYIKEYNETGNCKIWKDEYFKELSSLISLLVKKDEEVNAKMLHWNQELQQELTNSILKLLVDDFSCLSRGEICIIVQCLLRHQSTKSIDKLKIYNKWINLKS